MTRNYNNSNSSGMNNPNNKKSFSQTKEKRFSIHDAFEEETDEAIRVYGSTVISTPKRSKSTSSNDVTINFNEPRNGKHPDDSVSRDSDSLIQEYGHFATSDSNSCWRHPKIRENWRTVLAAVTLLVIGAALMIIGAYVVAKPQSGSQAAVFFIAGFICFIPGAYHVVYIWLAARGYRGFDFYHLPLFT